MESQINPNMIQERAEKLAAETGVADKAAADKAAADAATKAEADKSAADAAAKAEAEKAAADKGKTAPDASKKGDAEPKVPNDPSELRKWNTKVSQENAAIKEEIKGLRTALEKLTKKPIDYKELAKNPEAIQKQIEAERQEAIAEVQDQLQEAINRATTHETTAEKLKREQDAVNYPEWKRLFPIIQRYAATVDGRINFSQRPADVLDAMYELALQESPVQAAPPAPATPPTPGKTEAEIKAEIDAAEKRGFEKAQAALKDEQNGAGVGSAGKGGRRNVGITKEAYEQMPLKDLKKLISSQE